MSLSHYELGQRENNTCNRSYSGHYLRLYLAWLPVYLSVENRFKFTVSCLSFHHFFSLPTLWQGETHPRIRICRPSQLSCGHPSVHDGLWEQTEWQRADSLLVYKETIISIIPQAWTAFKAQWSLSLSSANRRGDESFTVFSSISVKLLYRQETVESHATEKEVSRPLSHC